jgi:hypothetical protein
MKLKFQAFHPYLTYKNSGKYFIRPSGEPSFKGWPSISHPTEMIDDALSLWRLGKLAFEALGEINSKDEFDEFYDYNCQAIRGVRLMLAERLILDPNSILFHDQAGENFSAEIDDFSNCAIVDILWQVSRQQPECPPFIAGMFLFACLEEIDSAIISMCLDSGYAISSALAAAEAYGNFQAIVSGNDNLQQVRSELAVRGAIERYKRDPKQLAKAFVKECWEQWQENPKRYKTQSGFASDVLAKVQTDDKGDPIISFDTVLKKWIPTWTRSKK